MESINWQKVIVGGVVAGIVLAVIDTLVGVYVVGPWLTSMPGAMNPVLALAPLGKRQMVGFPLSDILYALAMVWTYAAIRPRCGAGAKTAMGAGFLVWFVAAVAYGSYYLGRLMSLQASVIMCVVTFLLFQIAANIGCRLYTEDAAG